MFSGLKSKSVIGQDKITNQMPALLLAHMPDSLVELCSRVWRSRKPFPWEQGSPKPLLSSVIPDCYCLYLYRECGLAELCNIPRNRLMHVKKPANTICFLEAKCRSYQGIFKSLSFLLTWGLFALDSG